MMNTSTPQVFKKRVYFLCGFDTRGVRFYYRLFREEARKSQKHSGINITVSKPTTLSRHLSQSTVHAQNSNEFSTIDYRFLVWDDVVSQLWFSNPIKLIYTFIPIFLSYLFDGTHHKIRQAGNGAFLLIMYPFWFAFGSILLTLLIAFGVYIISQAALAYALISAFLSITSALFVGKKALDFGEKSGAWFMMQNYVFYTQWGRKPIACLEDRLDVFAQQIIDDYLEEPSQEILLVTHCTGGTLAMPIMARLVKNAPTALLDRLKLVTLGQCIPFLTYNPNAKHYRDTIQTLVNFKNVKWVDIGARIDPFSFDEVNPSIADGIQNTRADFPEQYIIRPSDMYVSEVFAKLKKQKLRLHFQYLMTSDLAVTYDYFQMITHADFDFNRLERAKLKPPNKL